MKKYIDFGIPTMALSIIYTIAFYLETEDLLVYQDGWGVKGPMLFLVWIAFFASPFFIDQDIRELQGAIEGIDYKSKPLPVSLRPIKIATRHPYLVYALFVIPLLYSLMRCLIFTWYSLFTKWRS